MNAENNTHSALPHIRLPIIVEGRYDKSAVLGMFSGTVITTDGFGIFNSKEKQALIKKISCDGIIILTDSDAGGKQIRSFISSIVPKDKIYQLYIPRIDGKEKRKRKAGREGVLGVEGVGGDVLRGVLSPFIDNAPIRTGSEITPADMFNLGLSGGENSSAVRDVICDKLSLPRGMNAKALISALNIISSREELENLLKK
ncbi:MAG: DUF4093 domain-containing protein [Ruminococcaceae bacterium]|nr:DUF4093 domain-containing protein [Oscillospiraceae bacterium]